MINNDDDDDRTPLYLAVRENDTKTVASLLQKFQEEEEDEDDEEDNQEEDMIQAARLAVSKNHVACLSLLLEMEAVLLYLQEDDDCIEEDSLINIAVTNDFVEIAELLMEKGNSSTEADVAGMQTNREGESTEVWYPIHNVASAAMVRALCQAGYDRSNLDFVTYYGETPLTLALERGQLGAAKGLLQMGANPNLGESQHSNLSNLALACAQGNDAVVQLLLQYNANPNLNVYDNEMSPEEVAQHQGNENEEDPLTMAVRKCDTQTLAMFLQNQATHTDTAAGVLAQFVVRPTPHENNHHASDEQHKKEHSKKGNDDDEIRSTYDFTKKSGPTQKSVLHLAIEGRYPMEIVKEILQRGCCRRQEVPDVASFSAHNVDALRSMILDHDSRGFDSLMIAAEIGAVDAVQLLLAEVMRTVTTTTSTATAATAENNANKACNNNIENSMSRALGCSFVYLQDERLLVKDKDNGDDDKDLVAMRENQVQLQQQKRRMVQDILLERGASILHVDNPGNYLDIAARTGDLELVKRLTESAKATTINETTTASLNDGAAVALSRKLREKWFEMRDNAVKGCLRYQKETVSIEMVQLLVNDDKRIGTRAENLVYATQTGRLELVKVFLDLGANPTVVVHQCVPCTAWLSSSTKEIAKLFWEQQHGAHTTFDVNLSDHQDCTLLHHATKIGATDVVRFVLGTGGCEPKFKQQAWLLATTRDVAEALWNDSEGADKADHVGDGGGGGHIDPNACDANGNSLLHLATIAGNVDLVKFLLTKIPSIDPSIKNNDTDPKDPLFFATLYQRIEVLEALLTVDAIGTKSREAAWTKITSADVAKVFVEVGGVCVNVQSHTGETQLHRAASTGNKELVEYLLSVKGIAINILDDLDRNPLFVAVASGARGGNAVVKCIVQASDAASITDALVTAARNDNTKAIQALLKKKYAKVDSFGNNGMTALQAAVEKGSISAARILHITFQANSRIFSQCSHKMSAIELAKTHEHHALYELFLQEMWGIFMEVRNGAESGWFSRCGDRPDVLLGITVVEKVDKVQSPQHQEQFKQQGLMTDRKRKERA